MKVLKNIMLVFMILMTSMSVSFAETDGSAIISAKLLSQTPDPAKAGDTVELSFSVENTGYETSNDLTVYLKENSLFNVIGENKINIGKLLDGQNEDYKQVFKFDVSIGNDVKSGSHELTLIVDDNNGNLKEYDFTIVIESQDSVEILSIDKSVISPGSQEEIKFTIKNVGTANLENLKFSLNSEDNVLMPVSSDNTYHIDSLKVGEEKEVVFDVIASTSITPDLYSLDLKLVYEDSLTGDSKEALTNAGIYIGGGTDFDIVFDEEESGEYAFTIANIGANDASSVKVSLVDLTGWKVSDRSSEIIGNLNKGDYTTTSFMLISTGGSNELNLEVEYTNTMGLRETTVKQVKVLEVENNQTMINTKVRTTNAVTGTGTRKGPMGGLASASAGLADLAIKAGIVLVVLIGAVIGIRKYKKKKSK